MPNEQILSGNTREIHNNVKSATLIGFLNWLAKMKQMKEFNR